MKKSILFLLLSTLILCTSCRKEYGYYEYTRLNIHLDLNGAKGNFEEVTEGDLVPTQNEKVRAQFFLFDAAGQLVSHQEQTADNYSNSLKSTLERLELGDYTLITATDMLEKDGNNWEPRYWEFTGTNSLNTFTVKGRDAIDSMGERLLTLTREEFTIDGRRQTKNLYLTAEPITAMVCVTYFDIFYWDKNIVGNDPDYRIYSYFELNYPHDMNEVSYTGGRLSSPWSCREATDFEYYILDRIYPNQLNDLNISSFYSYHALLPGKYSFRGYGEYNFRGHSDVYPDETRPTTQLTVESGMQYYIDFDIKSWTASFEESTVTRAEAIQPAVSQSIRALDIPVHTTTRTAGGHTAR